MKTTMQENRKSRTHMNAGKKLFILLFSLGLAYGASAQRGGHAVAVGHGGGYYGGGYYPRTYVGVGIGVGYPWGYYPYGFFGPWGYPYGYYPPYYYGYGAMPSQLELQVRDIRNDYDQQIKDVRHDKALTHKEKRQKIDQLKLDRDNAVVQARHDYFNNSRRNYNNQYNGNGQQPGNGNQNQPNQNQNNQQPKNGNGSSSSEGPEYQNPGSSTTGSK